MRLAVFLAALPILIACGGSSSDDDLRTAVARLEATIAAEPWWVEFLDTTPAPPEPTPAPDRIVGVVYSCQLWGSGESSPIAMGPECPRVYDADSRLQYAVDAFYPLAEDVDDYTVRIVVTAEIDVRTSDGRVYHTTVTMPRKLLRPGDPWPPTDSATAR